MRRKHWVASAAFVTAVSLLALGAGGLTLAPQEPQKPAPVDDQAHRQVVADLKAISRAFRDVARTAREGVVHIRALGGLMTMEEKREQLERAKRHGFELSPEEESAFLEEPRRKPGGTGSGIIWDAEGHILTNNHVVGSRSSLLVQLDDGRELEARVVGVDPKTDVALIKVDAAKLHPLRMGDSDDADVGDWVIAVGSPFGLNQTVTHGIISAKGRARVGALNIQYQDFIQTDAAINPGNSGGPLLNLNGEVIGINTAIATGGEDAYNAGIAFTIPVNRAVRIAEQLKRTGVVKRGWLGISFEEVTSADVEIFGLESRHAALVEAVFNGTPAAEAGFRVEDAIVSINGIAIEDSNQMRWLIADLAPGENATFVVRREGRDVPLMVTLGLQPENVAGDRRDAVANLPIESLGLLGRSLRPGPDHPYEDEARGVLVRGFARDSDKRVKDVNMGDLIVAANGQPVKSVASLLRELREQRTVELTLLEPDGTTKIVKHRLQ